MRLSLAPAVLTVLLASSAPASAQCVSAPTPPGGLDTCFGMGGKVLTNTSGAVPSSRDLDAAKGLALQVDGKILAAGLTSYDNGTSAAPGNVLLRYNPDGSLDQSFGAGGVVYPQALKGFLSQEKVPVIALPPDPADASQSQKILLGGTFKNGAGYTDFAAARFNPDGSLDTTFGTGGIATVGFGSVNSQIKSMLLQGDGKVVLVGTTGFSLARLNADGTLDTTFGPDGTGKVHLVNAQTNQAANSAALTADGSIIVLGQNRPKPTSTNSNFLMMRFTPGGLLDPTFGGGKGQVVTDFFGQADQGRSVAVDVGGRIIAAGAATVKSNATADYVVARYYPDGSLDTTFGTGGKVVTDFGGSDDHLQEIALDSAGRIVAVGYRVLSTSRTAAWDFSLARYSATGQLDASFGTGGKIVMDFAGGNVSDMGQAVVIQPGDGKIIAGGAAVANGGYNVALARLMP
jgi:uncharacterized delta-60 repeat protein